MKEFNTSVLVTRKEKITLFGSIVALLALPLTVGIEVFILGALLFLTPFIVFELVGWKLTGRSVL